MSPSVSLTGPFDESGSSQGPQTELYLADEATANTDTQTDQQDIPGQDDESALLAPYGGKTDFSYEGRVVPSRLPNGQSDPFTAVRDWTIEFESLCLSQQGIGFKLVDDVNGFSLDPSSGPQSVGVLVDEASWTVTAGEGPVVEWRLEAKRADGVQSVETGLRSDRISTEQANSTLNRFSNDSLLIGQSTPSSYSLGGVEEARYTRDIDLNVSQLIHNTDIPQVGVVETGVTSTFRVSGTVTDADVSGSLSTWAEEINTIAHGEFARIQETATQRVFEGALGSTSTTVTAGEPNRIEYTIELDIGSPETLPS